MTATPNNEAAGVTDEMVEAAADAYCDYFNGREGINTLALKAALEAAMALTPAPSARDADGEPIGWVFQHEETGRTTFCPNDGVNTPAVFVELNPRYVLCGPAYTTPPASVPVAELVALVAADIEYDEAERGLSRNSDGPLTKRMARFNAAQKKRDEILTALAQKGDARGQG